MITLTQERISLKSYRLIFHILILLLLIIGPVLLLPTNALGAQGKFQFAGLITHWLLNSMVVIPIYMINVYYLIPKLLKPGKYVQYATQVILCCIAGVLLIMITNNLMPPIDFLLLQDISGVKSTHVPLPPPGMGGRVILFPMIMSLTVGTSFEMIINWEIQRKEKAQIERERLMSELSFLKSQINPHFLFNALNNIYCLAEVRSEKTGDAVLMLSNLMRYMLYGSSKGKINLTSEIECIENYIAIQKMRISDREAINMQLNIKGDHLKATIEPLILLPFVENAFKHGVSYKHRSEVIINIETAGDQLSFRVYNTKNVTAKTENILDSDFGIGMNNVKRRLGLLYPDKHELSIHETEKHFEIELKISL